MYVRMTQIINAKIKTQESREQQYDIRLEDIVAMFIIYLFVYYIFIKKLIFIYK